MKSILGPGLIAGLFLGLALSATGQTSNAPANNSLTLPTQSTAANTNYQYDFIAQHYVWSNKPLHTTATQICTTMKDHAFSETPYGISGDQDWNTCLETQIRSIGYMRWLQNGGFKPTSKNRSIARGYLQKTYTMGRWGSYTFAQLRQAAEAAGTALHP